jgi:hypothetical protein
VKSIRDGRFEREDKERERKRAKDIYKDANRIQG